MRYVLGFLGLVCEESGKLVLRLLNVGVLRDGRLKDADASLIELLRFLSVVLLRVEPRQADETYVGGKPRGHPLDRSKRMTMSERIKEAKEKKTPVFGILERGGRVRTLVMQPMTKRGAQATLVENVDLGSSRLMTDESPLYVGIGEHLPHFTIKHRTEFVTGDDVHTQGIENFWNLLKRGVYGTFHHVTPAYLGMYADEFAFRYNARKVSDAERFASALQGSNGRLTWFFGKASSQAESPPTP